MELADLAREHLAETYGPSHYPVTENTSTSMWKVFLGASGQEITMGTSSIQLLLPLPSAT